MSFEAAAQVALDPLHFLKEFLTALIFIVVLGAVFFFRRTILLAVSGDDRVHITPLDCLYWTFCRCCGCCSGDWTRCFTRCPCCPRRFRGTNLVVWSGQWFGLTSYSVELKNLVVGDLPTRSRGNFYIAVECAANPELVTSLKEDHAPKVVHFPEVLTLRLRWSQLEQQVRIIVKALKVVGSQDLCQVFLDPNDVLHWSKYQSRRIMRFEMKTTDPSYQASSPSRAAPRSGFSLRCCQREVKAAETPPWIAMQFCQPTEVRDLDNFHGDFDTVRTASDDGVCQDLSVHDFKNAYQLLDQSGSAIQEPSEEDLSRVAQLRCLCDVGYWFCNAWSFVVIIVFLILRLYIWSCWNHYRSQTVAYMRNETFPVSLHRLEEIRSECDEKYKGTGLQNNTCRPSDDLVLKFCQVVHPMMESPKGGGEPKPKALSMLIYRYTGLEFPGVPCFAEGCGVRMQIYRIDYLLYGACVFLAVFACCCRILSQSAVRHLRHEILDRRSDHMRALNQMARAGQGGGGGSRGGSSGHSRRAGIGGLDSRSMSY